MRKRIEKLKYNILGIKSKSKSSDLVPKGLLHTLCPKAFIGREDVPIWDSHKFKNIKYLD